MDDLISRQEAIDAINASRSVYSGMWGKGLAMAINTLRDLPSAQPEQIRCKDCKYFLKSNEKCELIDTRLHFYNTGKTWTDDCFCAWADMRGGQE